MAAMSRKERVSVIRWRNILDLHPQLGAKPEILTREWRNWQTRRSQKPVG
jgi:hypothetical protein